MLSDKGNRMAAYASDALVDDKGNYVVVYSAENEAGYWQTTYVYETPEMAKETADHINETLGLSKDEVTKIVSSAIAAQNKMESFLRGEGVDPS